MKLFELFENYQFRYFSLFEENENNKKLLVIYGGRFQPPTPGHFEVYKWLTKHFGRENVYITTSDRTDINKKTTKENMKSFFNFEEKKMLWKNIFGIDEDKIILSKNPVFNPTEILSKFPPENTIFVSVTSEKDKERFIGLSIKSGDIKVEQYPTRNGIPINFNSIKKELNGYNKTMYYLILPEFKGISATKVRNIFQNDNLTVEEKKKLISKIYNNRMSDEIFSFINKKLNLLK